MALTKSMHVSLKDLSCYFDTFFLIGIDIGNDG